MGDITKSLLGFLAVVCLSATYLNNSCKHSNNSCVLEERNRATQPSGRPPGGEECTMGDIIKSLLGFLAVVCLSATHSNNSCKHSNNSCVLEERNRATQSAGRPPFGRKNVQWTML